MKANGRATPPQSANHSRLGGIFTLIAGGVSMIYTAVVLVALAAPGRFWPETPERAFAPWMYFAAGLLGVCAAAAIAGGIFALRKRHFALALTGAICGLCVLPPVGVAGLIFVSMARPEFTPQLPAPWRMRIS
jgi:hypothetical protein